MQPVGNLDLALKLVNEEIAEDDLLVLLSARDHNLSWSVTLENAPRQLATRFPQQPLLVIYAAENEGT